MLGERLGPCRLVAELGSGGMGTVYEAVLAAPLDGLAAGSRVAVKVMHPRFLESADVVRRFLREAEVGRSVRHPNVVRTLDAGEAAPAGDRVHYLVMEFVRGQTLRDILKEEGVLSEKLCRHIGRELARGLGAIHGTGVVHRDIKPENVLVTGGEDVRIMDLGVARIRGEVTRLTRTGVFVGSLQYASPEQLRDSAGEVDARTDLFSLGVLLHEAATGAHPFGRGDVAALMRRVLFDEPPRASAVNPGITPFFDEVLQRLLAKEPAQRFASAAEVQTVLAEGEESAWWRARARDLQSLSRRPLRRVRAPRRTPLIGRAPEMEALLRHWSLAREGRGQVVLLEGEAGIGKTRLVEEFLAGIEKRGEEAHLLFGSYPPLGIAAAAGAFSTAYRDLLGTGNLEEALRSRLRGSTGMVPALAALLLGESPPRGEESLSREALGALFVRLTRRLCAERPVAIVIDDLHFAPEQGLALFAVLAFSLAEERVLLVGTARPGLPRPWLAAIDGMEQVTRIPVGRLAPGEVESLLGAYLGSDRVSTEVGRRVLSRADGNPYFAFEILRGLQEGRFLVRDPEGTWVQTRAAGDLRIPSSVMDLIQARIADLDEEDRDVLDVAACCGFDFDPLVVGDVLGTAPIPLLKRIGRLERDRSLVRSVGLRCVFDHHQVQEALYQNLPELLRREYHAAIAGAVERREGAAEKEAVDLPGALCASLADHLLKGGRPERALRYSDRALDYFEESYLNDAALELAGRLEAVPGLLTREKRLQVLVRKAGRLELLGRWEEERRALEDAFREAEASGAPLARARVRRRLGRHLSRHALYDESLRMLTEALDLAQASGDAAEEAAVLGNLGVVCWHLGRHDEARGYHARTQALSDAAGAGPVEAVATGNLTEVYLSLGLNDDARGNIERQLDSARRAGDRRGEAIATVGLGAILYEVGEFEKARANFERALASSREIGDRRGEARAGVALGCVQRDLGRFGAAWEALDRGHALAREIGYRRGEVRAAGHLGRLARDLGQGAEAVARTRRCLDMSVELRSRRDEARAVLDLGVLLGEAGEAGEAETCLARAVELAEGLFQRRPRAAARLALARFLLSMDRAEEASGHLMEAAALATESSAPDEIVLVAVVRAALPGGDLWAAREILDRHAPRMRRPEEMEARFLLGTAAEDVALLADARRMLGEMIAGAPEGSREAMPRGLPIYARILGRE